MIYNERSLLFIEVFNMNRKEYETMTDKLSYYETNVAPPEKSKKEKAL
jgi:hypothetical protein